MMRFAIVCITLVSAELSFEEFKSVFGKEYSSFEDEAFRESLFNTNLKYIEETNTKNLTYRLGVNHFADRKPEEIEVGLAPSHLEALCGSAHLGPHERRSVLPESVDWVDKGVVSPIMDQGRCGSCWAISATGAVESAAAIQTNKLIALSPQQIMDCSRPNNDYGSCTGGRMYQAFAWDEGHDLCTATSYPYTGANSPCLQAKCTVGLLKGQVLGCKDVKHFSAPDLKAAVAEQPVSVAVSSILPGFQLYKEGVLTGICAGGGLDHGMLVVGYGTDPSAGDYFKVKNSWGTIWGEAGYGRFGIGGICWQSGEVGILSQPLYPEVKLKLSIV